jgi:hypothetical protein
MSIMSGAPLATNKALQRRVGVRRPDLRYEIIVQNSNSDILKRLSGSLKLSNGYSANAYFQKLTNDEHQVLRRSLKNGQLCKIPNGSLDAETCEPYTKFSVEYAMESIGQADIVVMASVASQGMQKPTAAMTLTVRTTSQQYTSQPRPELYIGVLCAGGSPHFVEAGGMGSDLLEISEHIARRLGIKDLALDAVDYTQVDQALCAGRKMDKYISPSLLSYYNKFGYTFSGNQCQDVMLGNTGSEKSYDGVAKGRGGVRMTKCLVY